jgi:predicted dehydrogenase
MVMQKMVRWGILGASKFARDFMARAIHAAEGAELVALATSDASRADGFKAFCPELRVHESYDALLADPGIDAVYIPLPNHLHLEWTLKALAAGKHVLTEKPIAMKAEEIDQIIAARDATGLLAAEAYMIVHHPQWIRARQLVQEGAIGRVLHVDAAFSYNLTDMENIRARPETGGGGIRDIGVYTFGCARFVTGAEPKDLSARVIMEHGVDVFAQVFGVMEGPMGRFTYGSMTAINMYNRQVVTFQGDQGMIRLDGGPFNANVNNVAQIELHKDGNTVLTDRWPASNHYVLQIEAFCRSVTTDEPYACTLEFARGTQSMIDNVFAVAVPV